MKRFLPVILVLVSFQTVSAQQANWSDFLSSPDDVEVYSCAASTDGNYYWLAKFRKDLTIDSYQLQPTDTAGKMLLLKTSKDGQIIWSQTAGSDSTIYTLTPYKVAVAPDNHIYTGGMFYNDVRFDDNTKLTGTSSDQGTGFLTCYNPDGTVNWAKVFTSTGSSRIESVAANQSYIVAGGTFTQSMTIDGTTLQSTYPGVTNEHTPFIAVFDATGALDYAIVFNTQSGFLREVNLSPDGNIAFAIEASDNLYLTSTATSEQFPMKQSFGNMDAYTGKIDISNGSLLWSERIGGTSYDYAYGLTTDTENNIYVSGNVNGDFMMDSADGSFYHDVADGMDYFAAKYDSHGNLIWEFIMGGSASDGNLGDIAVNQYGEVYSTAYYLSSDLVLNQKTYSTNGFASLLIKLSPEGKLDWAIDFSSSVSSARLWTVSLDSNGEILAGGHFKGSMAVGNQNYQAPATIYNGFLLSLHDDSSVGTEDLERPVAQLKVYPNPASDYVHIDPQPGETIVRSTLYNIRGQLIQSNDYQNQLAVSGLPEGIYILRVTSTQGTNNHKLIIQH
ncbi:T9SS type A sorting domain-containing protein [Prolixibacter denitrificans]|uniref:Putative secreted protein (Por secretion system target) n=1 Tax=Prolixibacter denitrificans TaxID=1541063 RepID=A0A2P8CI79_9BACT|nr:T9SS type A sorting domain-containing protein [Prolixibacter denitrificans]PSK84629.1 putative secreted protein (Por secretion system target) [Prolixibacter denitrificans]GET20795.1 hypothetical protein JCM18694_10410 [Prolixibacter denitrificans]